MVTIVEQSSFGDPNFDPSIFPFELEVFQAVALSIERTRTASAPQDIADAVQEALGLLRENADAFKKASLLKLSGDLQADKVAALLDRIRITTGFVAQIGRRAAVGL